MVHEETRCTGFPKEVSDNYWDWDPQSTSFKNLSDRASHCWTPIPVLRAVSNTLPHKYFISNPMTLSREVAGSTDCQEVLSLEKQTWFLCIQGPRVEYRSLVQFLTWSQICLLTEHYKRGLMPQKSLTMYAIDFPRKDRELLSSAPSVYK